MQRTGTKHDGKRQHSRRLKKIIIKAITPPKKSGEYNKTSERNNSGTRKPVANNEETDWESDRQPLKPGHLKMSGIRRETMTERNGYENQNERGDEQKLKDAVMGFGERGREQNCASGGQT